MIVEEVDDSETGNSLAIRNDPETNTNSLVIRSDPEQANPKQKKKWVVRITGNPLCIFCKGDHRGESCTQIEGVAQRMEFFIKNKLCMSCAKNHLMTNCKVRSCCRRCGLSHHTSLHLE